MDIVKLKADSYDIMVKIEQAQKDIEALVKTKEELAIKIATVLDKNETPLKAVSDKTKQEITNETRAKEQKIMEKRLQRIKKVN